MDHKPPALDCSCGIHGVPQPEHLALAVKALECTRAWQILRGDSNGLEYVRIIIVRGELADPVPIVNPIRHRLVPRWGVGATATQPLALDIHGDPPGTLRGSQFTLTGPVVIQTRIAKPWPCRSSGGHQVGPGPRGPRTAAVRDVVALGGS